MEPAAVAATALPGAPGSVDLWQLKYQQLKNEFKLLQEHTLVLAQEYEQAAASYCYEKECHEYEQEPRLSFGLMLTNPLALVMCRVLVGKLAEIRVRQMQMVRPESASHLCADTEAEGCFLLA